MDAGVGPAGDSQPPCRRIHGEDRRLQRGRDGSRRVVLRRTTREARTIIGERQQDTDAFGSFGDRIQGWFAKAGTLRDAQKPISLL